MKILAIETSCDETSVAVIEDGRRILANVIDSQISIHRKFGGVVPEIASRRHIEKIDEVLQEALRDSGLGLEELDAVAVTQGPGLVGALLVGVNYGKALAYGLKKPLIGVNHIDGHIAANYLAFDWLEPPFMALIVSGGHSHIVEVLDYGIYRLIGQTRDDAIGEAFDKVARTLGYGYPGGPFIDAASQKGDAEAIHFPRTYLEKDSYDFSFSGIKSAVLNYLNQLQMKGLEVVKEDVAASFQEAVVEVVVNKIIKATRVCGHDTLVVAGGVASNTRLREALTSEGEKNGLRVLFPDLSLCTDNGAMIGAAAYYQFLKNDLADLTLNGIPNLQLRTVDNLR